MPRGYPDDNVQSSPLGQTIADNAELAARLGAITRVQRSGQVVYYTDFREGTTDWNNQIFGDGDINVRANKGIFSNTCLYVYSGTALHSGAQLLKIFPVLDIYKMGVESFLMWIYDVIFGNIVTTLAITVCLGTTAYGYVYDFYPNTGEIRITHYPIPGPPAYYTINVGYSLFASLVNDIWHFFKAIVDPANNNYGVLLFDSQKIDLSGYHPSVTPAVAIPNIQVNIIHTTNPQPNHLYVGSMVLTINEP